MSTATLTTSVNSFASVNSTTINNQKIAVELAIASWRIAEKLKGKIDIKIFSQYVASLLFYRFISENLTYYLNKEEQKNKTIEQKGFFIEPELLFENVLNKLKNNPYFIPENTESSIFSISTRAHTKAKIDSKYDILDISLLIDGFFSKIFCSYIDKWYTERTELSKKWYELFGCVQNEFSLLGDTNPLFECSEEQIPQLVRIIKKKNKKLLQMINEVATIPLNDLVKETSNYNLKELLEIQEEVNLELFKFNIIYSWEKLNKRR